MVFWATLLTGLVCCLVAVALGFIFRPALVRLYRYWVGLCERDDRQERENRENADCRKAAIEELENLERTEAAPKSVDQTQPNRTGNP